ncbi:MAG TPA: hypothetical protein VFX22_12230, partial [Candidatus Kapabacteria bacterium]|nr:hypothetical protein [Candidatus Kapabacteria bacterium]
VSGTLALSASVLGFSHTGTVTWSVEGQNNGTIVANGLNAIYTAPPAVNSLPMIVNILVTSDEDQSRSVVCPVSIINFIDTAFSVSPDTLTLLTNATQQFSIDSITMAPQVRWEVASRPGTINSAGPGTINSAGLYTPPATIDSDSLQVTVRATSVTDNTVFSESVITLLRSSDSLLCYSRDILPTLAASCGASGCHDAGGRAGFNALTYSGTVNGQNVKPGDARGSRLFQAMTQFDANTRMPPPPQPAMPQAQVLKIGQWINEGANDCQ